MQGDGDKAQGRCYLARMIDPRIQQIRNAVLEDGIFLAVRLDDGAPVVAAVRAAARGGLRVPEITLTTPGALKAIETLANDEGLVVGAGTVLDVDDVRRVADAGGKFAMSPVLDEDVVAEAHRLGMLAVAGGGTATEILAAHRAGATLVKVFPSGPLGGPDFLRKVRAPLPGIPLVPTSGPTAETFADWYDAGAVAVGVGREVFAPGFTEASVEKEAGRLRAAWDRARGRPA